MPGLSGPIKAMDSGAFHVCILHEHGSLGFVVATHSSVSRVVHHRLLDKNRVPTDRPRTLQCYGNNGCYQCSIPEDLQEVILVAAGDQHTCAVTSAGKLVCFGEDHAGQCSVPPDLGPICAVSAGTFHTCAVTADKRLACFGSNRFGQCEAGQFAVEGAVSAVAAGGKHTCVIENNSSSASPASPILTSL